MTRSRSAVTVVRVVPAVLVLFLVAGNASGQQLIWDRLETLSEGADTPQALILTKNGVMVAGQANGSGDGFDFVIQTLGRANGKVKSTVRNFVPFNCPGTLFSYCYDRQFVVHLSPMFYTLTPTVSPDGSETEIAVTAFDENSAAIEWMDYWSINNDLPSAIAASRQAVVVASEGGAVRAYDPIVGTMLWEDRLDTVPGRRSVTVGISGNRAFAAAGTTNAELQVRSYNARSGRYRWDVRRSIPVSPRKLLAHGADLFVAGLLKESESSWRPYLTRVDAASGVTLWEDATDVAPPARLATLVDLAVDGERIIASISAVAGPTGQALVRAYRRCDGQALWTTTPVELTEAISKLVVNSQRERVYAVGYRIAPAFFSEVVVRGYDAVTGGIVWEDFSHRSLVPPASSTPFPSGIEVVVGEHRLFVAGVAHESQSSGPGHFLIRAYDITYDR